MDVGAPAGGFRRIIDPDVAEFNLVGMFQLECRVGRGVAPGAFEIQFRCGAFSVAVQADVVERDVVQFPNPVVPLNMFDSSIVPRTC